MRATKDSWDGKYAEDILVDTDALAKPLARKKTYQMTSAGT